MKGFFLALALVLAFAANAQAECTVEVDITETIGPATVDLLARVDAHAEREKCGSILLLINTPGGSLESTRIAVERILNSKHAYLCLVSPSGGHAGSAGAIILQACHVNGAVNGTNLGAATPVSMGGELPKDLRQKIMNDTRSWLESLTRLRGRSDKFGQDIILEAKAVTAEDALKLKAIDWVGASKVDFLKFAEGREVKMVDSKLEKVRTGDVKRFEHDARHKALTLFTDPQLAYMLLLGSLALLYFEITHPGTMIAGVVGAMGLIIALIALHKLDVEYGGLVLILLGIGLLVAEMFLPTFGILGVGGLVSFVLGSIFLFDPVKSYGYRLPYTIIAPVVLVAAICFVGVSSMLIKSRSVRKKGGYDEMIGVLAPVISVDGPQSGMLEIAGELWKFQSETPVEVGQRVRIAAYQGLVLKVKKEI